MKMPFIIFIALFLVLPFFSKAAVNITDCNYKVAKDETVISGKISALDSKYIQIIRFSFSPRINSNISFEVGELQLSAPGQFVFSVKDFVVPVGYTLSWNIISKPIATIGIPGQIPKTEFQ